MDQSVRRVERDRALRFEASLKRAETKRKALRHYFAADVAKPAVTAVRQNAA